MPISRRTILAAAGGSLALIAVGGIWRVTRRPASATAPWALDGPPPDDVRLDAFRHAILAPNPHNMQPWRIRLDGGGAASITCDLARRLPETDPFDRQITIGFGCFLELARIAAAERGQVLAITPFPEGTADRLDTRPIAALAFSPGAGPDPLFAAIPDRRSNKLEYDLSRPLADATLEPLLAATGSNAAATTDPALIAGIRAIVLRAIDIEYRLPRAHGESIRVMRIGADAIDAASDGIALDGPMIETMVATGTIDHAALADPASMAWQSGAEMMVRTYGSAPAFVWITTPGNDRATQLAAGRAYARLNLAATAAGLAIHPMSQSLQEYPEMAEPYAAIHKLLAPTGGTVQMLARIGHAPAVPPAPRWPLEAKLARG